MSNNREPAHTTEVILHKFGDVPGMSLDALAAAVAGAFRIGVTAGAQLPLPQSGFDPHRGQHATTAFLKALAALDQPGRAPGPALVRLGITEKDLFVPRLNFVFGEADPAARLAVISTRRLNPAFHGEEPDLELFQLRIFKEAVHELGHVFGLEHCANPYCIMRFSNTLADTDRKGPGFCRECQLKLAMRGLGHER